VDYDFFRDEYEAPCVQCSMEYEAMGVFLTEELAKVDLIEALLVDVDLIESQKLNNKEFQGKEFLLKLNRDDAIVRSNILDSMSDDEIPEELNYYDSQSESMCGLDDFKALLEDWLDHVKSATRRTRS
tara:strand:- start:386 stop:769 length:384 start_codon:yes stop_codon:yes gene_type:complete